jgi:hypothetical protein
MGKAARYDHDETHVLAKAWLTATYSHGTDQKTATYENDIYEAVAANAPHNALEGTYHHRKTKQLVNY